MLFGRRRAAFERTFPGLKIAAVERLAGLSYPTSGGFSRMPLLPALLWNALRAMEDRLPPPLFHLIGFRLLVTLQRT